MKTIPIQTEISIKTAVHCANLLRKQQTDPSTLSIEVTVRSVLEGLTNWLEKIGQLPKLPTDESEIVKLFEDIYGQLEIDFSSLVIGPTSDQFQGNNSINPDPHPSPTKPKPDIDEIARLVESKASPPPDPHIERSTDPIETTDIGGETVDLSMVNRMDIQTLAKLAPKDVIVERCLKGLESQEFIWAVEAIYTKLSPDLWGTPPAEGAIMDLLKRHKRSV